MPSQLESLPNELLQKILIFAAGNVQEMLRAELTSHALQRVVQDDKTWKWLPGIDRWEGDNRLTLNRQKACVSSTLDAVVEERRKEMDSTRPNVIIDELGADGWRNLVTSALLMGIHHRLDPVESIGTSDLFVFRGDTLFVLAELVHDHLIRTFSKANNVAIEFAVESDQYPMLSGRFLQLFGHEQLMRELETTQFTFLLLPNRLNRYGSYRAAVRAILADNDSLRTRIIRRLSLRAGVVRMNNDAFDFAWFALVHMISLLVRPACAEAFCTNMDICFKETEERQIKERKVLPVHNSIREVAPISFWGDVGGVEKVFHTIVPKQIEDAAMSVFGNVAPYKVYGDFWVSCDKQEGSQEWFQARNQAIADAESQYIMSEDDDTTGLRVTWPWSDHERDIILSDDESGDEWTDDELASQEDEDMVVEEEAGGGLAGGDVLEGEREDVEMADGNDDDDDALARAMPELALD